MDVDAIAEVGALEPPQLAWAIERELYYSATVERQAFWLRVSDHVYQAVAEDPAFHEGCYPAEEARRERDHAFELGFDECKARVVAGLKRMIGSAKLELSAGGELIGRIEAMEYDDPALPPPPEPRAAFVPGAA